MFIHWFPPPIAWDLLYMYTLFHNDKINDCIKKQFFIET